MADISDQTINLRPTDSVCLGKLLDDSQHGGHAGQTPAKIMGLEANPSPDNCLVFTPLAELRPQADTGLAKFTYFADRYGQDHGLAAVGQAGDSPSRGLRPYFGVANALHPGQPLAFDSDGHRLSFADNKSPIPTVGLDSLNSNGKIYPALVFGVNMRF